ncbi:MAG: helix-turn-helix transcriptional regulator [Pseudomonadota bacterium]|nr:helix-turn-helix transcriptional regulator [Pseudomonadota bacterium]
MPKAAGLNQEDAAHNMDALDRGYLSGIENGKRNPSTSQLFKIAKGLGVRPKDLFNYAEANEGAEADYLEKIFWGIMKLSESDKRKILKIIDEAEEG